MVLVTVHLMMLMLLHTVMYGLIYGPSRVVTAAILRLQLLAEVSIGHTDGWWWWQASTHCTATEAL